MKVAILNDYQNVAAGIADWDSVGAELVVFTEHIADPDELARRLAGCEVVVAMRERTKLPAAVLERLLPDLKLIISLGGSRNPAIDLRWAQEHGIVTCHTGYTSEPTAELTWALILAAQRNLATELRAIGEGGWQSTVGLPLHGTTLGLLGLGRLGSRVAKVGQAFGMQTIAWSQNLTTERAAEHGVEAVSKDELIARSDVLSLHVVLSERTRGIIGAAEIAAMKPGALLVNTSRGPVVDEAALLDALGEGRIRAALDVFDTEPLAADHPLRRAPNVTLTPHIGYGSRNIYEIFYRDAVEDIAAFQKGEPIRVMPGTP